jgi:hypothetical protein
MLESAAIQEYSADFKEPNVSRRMSAMTYTGLEIPMCESILVYKREPF